MVQWQLPQLCDVQPPQPLPATELEKPSPDAQPNEEKSFSTSVPWHWGQSGFLADIDISCSNVREHEAQRNSYIGIPLYYNELRSLSIPFFAKMKLIVGAAPSLRAG